MNMTEIERERLGLDEIQNRDTHTHTHNAQGKVVGGRPGIEVLEHFI